MPAASNAVEASARVRRTGLTFARIATYSTASVESVCSVRGRLQPTGFRRLRQRQARNDDRPGLRPVGFARPMIDQERASIFEPDVTIGVDPSVAADRPSAISCSPSSRTPCAAISTTPTRRIGSSARSTTTRPSGSRRRRTKASSPSSTSAPCSGFDPDFVRRQARDASEKGRLTGSGPRHEAEHDDAVGRRLVAAELQDRASAPPGR